MRTLRLVLVLVCWVGLSTFAWGGPSPADGVGLLWGSAADTDRPTALRLNPAGLSFQPSWGIHYIHADAGIPFRGPNLGDGDGLFLSFKPLSTLGVGFGLQLLYPGPVDDKGSRVGFHTRLTLGAAWRFGKWFSFGMNIHSFLGSPPEIQRLGMLDLGLTWRPSNIFSFGLMVRNLNVPVWGDSFIPRKWELSLAIRPLQNERWVLSADVHLPETGQGATFQYRTEFEPVSGLVVGFRATHGADLKTLQVGTFLGFRFGQWGLRVLGQANISPQNANNSVSFGGLAASLWYSQTPYRPLVRPNRRMPMLDLSGALPERVNDFPLGGVKPLFLRVIMALDRVARDPSVAGIMLRLGSIRCGMAKVQELRAALMRIKKRGKKIVVYLTSASMKTYYLASLADRIYMYPDGSVQISGLAFKHIFYAGFFEKIGIKAQFVKFGKYKTAPNQYIEKQMTPAQKEAYKVLLDDLFGQLINDLAASRKKTKKVIRSWIKHAWFTAAEAVKMGLIDKTLPWGKVIPEMKKALGNDLWLDVEYFKKKTPSRWRGHDRIAVLHVDGAIVSGAGLDDPLFGTRLSGSHTLIRYLLRAQFDSNIRAVVLRVDSPGGGVLASDMIWRYIAQLQQIKPVIVSMATVAASGGYYISAPAAAIFAMPATVTGSIGIYAGKFNYSGLLKKLGVNIQFQKRGALAGFFTPFQPFSAGQIKRLRSYILAGYESFLRKVIKGRKKKLTMKKLRTIAAGRIWSGARAQKLGLVDRIGGLWDAIQYAGELAGMRNVRSTQLVSWPSRGVWRLEPRLALGVKAQQPTDPLARLFRSLYKGGKANVSAGVLFAQWIQQWRSLLKSLQKAKIWALQPYLLYTP